MSIWQMIVLIVMAGCAIGCLVTICMALQKLVKVLSFIGTELTKLSAKLERVEAVDNDDTSLEAVEAALANFEKLKRIDIRKS